MKQTFIKQRYILRLGFVSLFFLVPFMAGAFMLGCSDTPMGVSTTELGNQPTQPETDFSFDAAEVVEFDPDAEGVEAGGPVNCAVRHWIRARDFTDDRPGVLSLWSSMRLLVDAGAVPEDVTITGEVWYKTCPDGTEWVVYEFLPEMNFLEPVELHVKKSAIVNTADDSGQFFLWYFNPRTGAWELSDVGVVLGEIVIFQLEHFSKYAIGR
jgi:hypothetical protein